MTEDDVLREVRVARAAYARAHHFDVRAMVANLRARDAAGDGPVVRRAPRRPPAGALPAAAPPSQAPQKTGAA